MAEESEFQAEGRIWLLVIFVLVLFAGALVYFSRTNLDLAGLDQARVGPRPNGTRQPRVYTVFYNIGVFSPTNIRIHVGDSVRFQNDSDEPVRILSDSTDGVPDLVGFDSIGDIQPGGTFAHTFTKTGTFGYRNARDRSERGTVIVRP